MSHLHKINYEDADATGQKCVIFIKTNIDRPIPHCDHCIVTPAKIAMRLIYCSLFTFVKETDAASLFILMYLSER